MGYSLKFRNCLFLFPWVPTGNGNGLNYFFIYLHKMWLVTASFVPNQNCDIFCDCFRLKLLPAGPHGNRMNGTISEFEGVAHLHVQRQYYQTATLITMKQTVVWTTLCTKNWPDTTMASFGPQVWKNGILLYLLYRYNIENGRPKCLCSLASLQQRHYWYFLLYILFRQWHGFFLVLLYSIGRSAWAEIETEFRLVTEQLVLTEACKLQAPEFFLLLLYQR